MISGAEDDHLTLESVSGQAGLTTSYTATIGLTEQRIESPRATIWVCQFGHEICRNSERGGREGTLAAHDAIRMEIARMPEKETEWFFTRE